MQETVSGSGISWAVCKSAPRPRQITTPAPHRSVFYRPDAILATQPTASKHWKHSRITHTHTHPFNGPFSKTTQVSRYKKGKTSLDFTDARDSEWQWHQLGCMQVCISLQTDNPPGTHHSVFYRLDALPAAQPTASKHWSAIPSLSYNTHCKYKQNSILMSNFWLHDKNQKYAWPHIMQYW